MLIGLMGHPGHGKSTVADIMYKQYSFSEFAFANPLKEAACNLFGIEFADFSTPGVKDNLNTMYGMSPRELVKDLGRVLRDAYPTLLLDSMTLRIFPYLKQGMNVVITDVRMEAEVKYVLDYGGTIIGVVRAPSASPFPPPNYAEEPTESYVAKYLKQLPASQIIYNDGSKIHLREKVGAMITLAHMLQQ